MTKPHANLRASSLPGQVPLITPVELAERIRSANPPLVLDVREEHEVAQCCPTIASWCHIPMSQVLNRMEELPKDRTIAVMCKAGGRSATVTRLLKAEGYDALNLHGGVVGWKTEIEPQLPEIM